MIAIVHRHPCHLTERPLRRQGRPPRVDLEHRHGRRLGGQAPDDPLGGGECGEQGQTEREAAD
ncbi:MAG: hypothetical protein R2708_09415 [Vicinamibacterales bacterium]